ncbi:MAG: DUF3078 domain-containing protein [Flavobacteriales bacterium]|nr:DUF3078 domain-containing protein [Flavobacteriales bacterium]
MEDSTQAVIRSVSDTSGTLPVNQLRVLNSSLYGSLSASYASSSNWYGQDLSNFAVAANLLYTNNLFADSHNHSHQVMLDLGYLKFVDSTWEKSLDQLQVNLLWNTTGKRINTSYTVSFGTQFLPSSYPEYDFEQDILIERAYGGFLNPFNLQLGYGGVFSFWGKSNINFAFATLQVSSSPKGITSPTFIDANVIEGKRAYYFMNYGFSIAAAINKPFGDHVQWVNNTRFFGNGLDRDHVNLQLSNMVIVKLWKYLQLRFDTRLAYNPLLNYQMQFRQEALIGFFYERQK